MNFNIINIKKQELGITNQMLANESGVTQSTIDKITAGINQNPKLDTLQAIAKVIGCTLDDFSDAKAIKPGEAALMFAERYERLNDIGKQLINDALSSVERAGLTSPVPRLEEE